MEVTHLVFTLLGLTNARHLSCMCNKSPCALEMFILQKMRWQFILAAIRRSRGHAAGFLNKCAPNDHLSPGERDVSRSSHFSLLLYSMLITIIQVRCIICDAASQSQEQKRQTPPSLLIDIHARDLPRFWSHPTARGEAWPLTTQLAFHYTYRQ
jgi:hypothetical protein